MTSNNLLSSHFSLSGKTALICGASQGIGKAIAIEFAKAGAQVISIARSETALISTVDELNKFSFGHTYEVCDLSQLENVELMIQSIRLQLHSGLLKNAPSILINNSAGPKGGPLTEGTTSELAEAFQTHLVTSHRLMQEFLPDMKNKKFGRIINVLSTSVKTPLANLGVSNTIRGSVAQWAKTLANELGPYGITVNNLLPGFTKTERLESLKNAAAHRSNTDTKSIEDQWIATIPARRFAEPQELGLAALFLASPAASYINGINLPVDGGRTPAL